MKVKAKVCFCGIVNMSKGEVRDIKDKYVLDDLIKAGYVEVVEKPKKTAK